MKFDICVGNPPYGGKKKGSSDFLHYMIMRTVLDFCTDKLCFIMPSKPIVRQLKEPWYSMFKNAVCTDIAVVNKSMSGQDIIIDNMQTQNNQLVW